MKRAADERVGWRGGSGRRADADVAGQALRLRRWALAVFAGTVNEAPSGAARDAPVDAWRVFLAVERCALALRQNPAAGAVFDALPPPVGDVVKQVHTREMLHAMSARMQLTTLSRLAQRLGTQAVVLKGGVAIAGGAMVQVADVDVLVPVAEAARFADALVEENGFRRSGVDLPMDARGGHHLAPRYVPDAVMVEVHFALPAMPAEVLIGRAVPLPGYPGLLRPSPEDHLRHLLHHAVAEHPERAGRLRDLLLIAAACQDADPGAAVVSRLRGRPAGERAATLAAFAARLEAGAPGDDPFSRLAAVNYLITAETTRTGRAEPRLLRESACALLNGHGEYRRLCVNLVRSLDAHSGSDAARSVARVARPLFRPLRLAWRGSGLLRAAPRALDVVGRARRLAREG